MDQSQGEWFYVNLPSNASLSVFKNNTSSNYQTDLAQHVDLAGLWDVALTEITYPHTWFNLPEEDAHFEWKHNNGEKHRQKIRGGYCDDLYQLQQELNSHPRELGTDISFKYSNIKKRFDYAATSNCKIRLFQPLAYMLGMNPFEWFEIKANSSPYPVDI
ncbi:hypothetical protein F2P81_001378 [Scophthalmus maximus]|uniref:Uncharacterized protein n=1 Tax=Scophthalmus maximus TaxID=52904 RepID=A0A6A4TR42_SCOMX|nr:hypothetical protein F2P81_001378 [Scophthalmus maximus]